MPSIADQKANLRELICKRVEKYIAGNPDKTNLVAMGGIQRLASRMTLNELKDWHIKVSAIVDQED